MEGNDDEKKKDDTGDQKQEDDTDDIYWLTDVWTNEYDCMLHHQAAFLNQFWEIFSTNECIRDIFLPWNPSGTTKSSDHPNRHVVETYVRTVMDAEDKDAFFFFHNMFSSGHPLPFHLE